MRYVRFRRMRSRDALFPLEPNFEAFLTDMAVHGHVAAVTQNQAMNALGFLNTCVPNHALPGRIDAVRTDKKINVPGVMTHDEVAAVLWLMEETAQLGVKLLYGSGLRIIKALQLRVKDIVDQMNPLTVRSGKVGKDRFTTFLTTLTPLLQNHVAGIKTLHQQDLAQRPGEAHLPICWRGNTLRHPRHRAGHMSFQPRISRCSPSEHHPSPSQSPQRHSQG